ncbi:propionate-- ligase, putative [Ichthyophthirius multifiliis]|uniref:Propionate--ligase, putative n=1 Tax=Ichthyophthirius multifiliis TaxID=5932 RepID=G0R1G1_ICHMU|nr:propionate-- ligase, putative [Ichthyophthirius multifiliis]EGR28695.1 propionate-- ligase, putative [Ichthyophthirius multifiliis]|eukprot:XP_004029931.1 propionate-- ligase, putative [Ichthyophthirius multifiliis]
MDLYQEELQLFYLKVNLHTLTLVNIGRSSRSLRYIINIFNILNIYKKKVKGLYTAPTALRAIRKEDPEGKFILKSDISSLQGVSMAGERCDVPTYEWIQSHLKVFINDNYWQTEIGWIISCNYKNLHTFPIKPGSAIKPAPGFIVHILDQNNNIINEADKLGKICIKLPLPPSFMLTLYNNDEAFVQKYLKDAPGYYQSGDCGYFDNDGYLNVMTRIDDVINTAGHRLSTAQIEECLLSHNSIVESAVIAKKDNFKGEIPVGFVVVKQGYSFDKKILEQECVAIIRKLIGPVASFQHCIVVEKLPKTRSGKILRYTLKRMVDGLQIEQIPSTIEDASVLNVIKKNIEEYEGFGKQDKDNIIYKDQIDNINGNYAELVNET